MAWASLSWGTGVLPAAATSVEAVGPSAATSEQPIKASCNFIARFIGAPIKMIREFVSGPGMWTVVDVESRGPLSRV
jgi:hypothetical protein